MLENDEETTSINKLKAEHRRERKELQMEIMKMKNSAKDDKRRKREVANEVAKLEEEMKVRHEKELEALLPSPTTVISDEPSESSSALEQNNEKNTRISKAQKRRAKKAELNRKRKEAANQDLIDAENAPRKLEREAIERVLANRGLAIYNIPPDGDCLYGALAHQLTLVSASQVRFKSRDIRQKAAAYMRSHKDEFLPFLTNDHGEAVHDFEFEEYCMKVEKCSNDGGVWGGEPELRAAACALERRVEVIQLGEHMPTFGEEFEDKKPLIITFHRYAYNLGEHYNSTVPMKSMHDGVASETP